MIEQNYAFISQSAQTLKKTIVLLRLIRKVVTMKTKCPNDSAWIFKKKCVLCPQFVRAFVLLYR